MTPGLDTAEILDGRYRLLRPLAKVTSGGFVHAAEHVHTRKRCAVKVLDPNASAKVRKRMRREMEALAVAQGPGVVDFRDGGESDDRLYLVLELLEGRTLAGLLAAKGRLSVAQAAKIGADVARALCRCHERGVVHRDIKPANVFVTADESVQLLDFGIAKLAADAEGREVEKLTQENTLVGTPEYMAPEALLASPDVDEHADQYGLGVTLYEMLTGTVPFEGSYPEVLHKVHKTQLRPVRAVREDVPEALDAIITRALRHDPAERYASMAEMGQALDALVGSAAPTVFEHRAIPRRDAATVADAPAAKARAGHRRRRHARAAYVTLARVRQEGGEHIDGRVEEISESGFQFVGVQPVVEGAHVVVRFALPISGRILEAGATSRWSRSVRGLTAAGFELDAVPVDALEEIRRYVSLMCPE